MVDNEFIQRGYRIGFNSVGKVLKSLFKLHNESVNVWSHMLGVLTFLVLIVFTFTML
jgi:adiponectin receptor